MRALLLPVAVACVALLLGALQAEDRPPGLTDILFQRANERMDAGLTNEGVAELAHVLRLDPAHAGARQRLASFLTQRTYALPVSEWKFPRSGGSPPYDSDGKIFSRDGERVLLLGEKDVQLFETRTGKAAGPKMPSHCIPVFRADSKVLAVATSERTVELISTVDGKPMRLERKFEHDIEHMGFLGNTGVLAVNIPPPRQELKQYVFWDTEVGGLLDSSFGRDVKVYLMQMTADARSVVLVGVHRKRKEHWAVRIDLAGWKKVSGPSPLKNGGAIINYEANMRVRDDCTEVSISLGVGFGGPGETKTWSVETGDLTEDKGGGSRWSSFEGPRFTADQSRPGSGFAADWRSRDASKPEQEEPRPGIASELVGRFFGPDGQLALGTYEDGTVTLQGLADRTLPEARHPWRTGEARFLRGGQEMAVLERPNDEANAPHLRISQWRSGPSVTFWPTRHLRGTDVRLIPQADRLLVLSESGEMSHWDARTGVRLAGPVKFAEKYQRPYRPTVFPVDRNFSADNGKFLAPTWDGYLQLFDTVTLRPAGGPVLDSDESGFDGRRILSPDGLLAAKSENRDVVVFDPKTGKTLGRCTHSGEEDSSANPVAFDSTGTRLAARDSGSPFVYDWRANKKVTGQIGDQTTFFIPGQPLISTHVEEYNHHGYAPPMVTFWNLNKPPIVGREWAGATMSEISAATAFTLDGKLALTCAGCVAGQQDAVKLWRLPELKLAYEPIRVPSGITAVAFSRDGAFFATLGKKGVRVWETKSGTARTEWMVSGGYCTLEFSHDGRLLLAHDQQGAWIYDLTEDEGIATDDLVVLAEAAAGLRVNPVTLRAEAHDGFPALAELRSRKPDSWFFQPLDERTLGPHGVQRLSQMLDECYNPHADTTALLHAYPPALMAAYSWTDDANRSAAHTEAALARSRTDPLVLLYASRGALKDYAEDFPTAATLARTALRERKGARFLAEAAFYDWRDGDFATAEARYREACALDGSHADWWAMRALLHAMRGEKAQAAETFAAAAKIGAGDLHVRYVLGWAKLHLGEYDEAATWFDLPRETPDVPQPEFPPPDHQKPQHLGPFWEKEITLAKVTLGQIAGTLKDRLLPVSQEEEDMIFKRHHFSGKAKAAVRQLFDESRKPQKAQKQ